MRSYISYFALGFALVGGASVANAQTVITQQPVVQTAEYDVVPPPPAAVAPPAVAPIIGQPVGYAAPVPTYRFVYEPDRILVIDNATGIAVQAIPR
jgi:hypothetical protein